MPTRNTTRGIGGVFSTYDACPHCHRPLKRITVELFGKPHEVTCYGSCGCEESKWDGMDVEAEDRKYVRAGIPLKYLARESDLHGHAAEVYGGKSLYVWGPNGTGKSTFAANLSRALVNMGRTVLFRNSKLLTEEIKGTFSGDADGILERCYGVDVLVIDDLGKEQPTDYSLSMLYAVIEARYGDMKPVVVTSNHRRGQLVERWAPVDESTARAIASRLCESVTVEMSDRDWRVA